MNVVSRLQILRSSLMALVISVTAAGCGPVPQSKYAAANGTSINGVSVFVDLLRKTGHQVDLWRAVTPRLKQGYPTLIVFHSSFKELSKDVRREIQGTMISGGVKTLIIVVRDNDAAVDYWRQIRDRSEPSDIKTAAGRAYDRHKQMFDLFADAEFTPNTGTWYGLKRADRSADSFTRNIDVEGSGGVVTVEARWPMNRRLEPAEGTTTLWSTGSEPLLTLDVAPTGKIFVLESATPLLNGGLVDSGNRRLAADLISRIPPDDRVAIATSSDWYDRSALGSPGMLKFMIVHPNGWVFGQGILALVMFCWWKFPIFGRPRQTIDHQTARFGAHVEALARLLRKTKDTVFARQRVREWLGDQKHQKQ